MTPKRPNDDTMSTEKKEEWLPLEVHTAQIAPGEHELIRMRVGRLPSNTPIHLYVHVYRSTEPGPTLLVLAGVHGDEINGVEIVRRAVVSGVFEQLQRGTVIAIPLLNIYGFNNFSREVPDGKDVNRSFPGTRNGSLAARVARILSRKILPLVDFGVDFHTGGRSLYNHPQIRYTRGDERAQALARAFAAPVLLAQRPIPKSLRRVAHDAGKPILIFEGGESQRFDGFAIENGLAGLQRLMHAQDMLPEAPAPPAQSFHFEKTSWVRAARAGIFRWTKRSGHFVRRGEPLGFLTDPYGQDEVPVIAPKDGFLIGQNNAPVVSQGDALFHLAYEG